MVLAVKGMNPPVVDSVPSVLKKNSGCFVTLTINGNLRGCIGYIEPIKPLYQAVIDNARSAALSDPRFSPVRQDELGKINVEVSVLSNPVPLEFKSPDDLLQKLKPGVHGVILQKGPYHSTFLPQVWEQLPDKIMFLEHLSMKGECPETVGKHLKSGPILQNTFRNDFFPEGAPVFIFRFLWLFLPQLPRLSSFGSSCLFFQVTN
jgi:AmmeMemoRadiSam system protein A